MNKQDNSNKLNITVIIICQNEEENIKYAIDSVINHFSQVIVVDSYSKDETVNIVKSYQVVDLYQNEYHNWAQQRNWALKNCNIINEYVFFLDADEYIGNDFIIELKNILSKNKGDLTIYVNPVLVFFNKKLKYAYGHPIIKRIFKKDKVEFVCEGAREYSIASGDEYYMKAPLFHHNRKSFKQWIIKHINNAEMEARYYFEEKRSIKENVKAYNINNLIRKKVWNKLPIILRPFIYFIYRYFFRFGFIDGIFGFIYCFFHSFWYQLLIDLFILERKLVNNE